MKPKDNQWYSSVPEGHNALSAYLRSMTNEAQIDGNFTNCSLLVTTVTRHMDNGEDEDVLKKQKRIQK